MEKWEKDPKGPTQEAVAKIVQGAGRMMSEAWNGDDVADCWNIMQRLFALISRAPNAESCLIGFWSYAMHYDHSLDKMESENIPKLQGLVRDVVAEYGLTEEVSGEGDRRGREAAMRVKADRPPQAPF